MPKPLLNDLLTTSPFFKNLKVTLNFLNYSYCQKFNTTCSNNSIDAVDEVNNNDPNLPSTTVKNIFIAICKLPKLAEDYKNNWLLHHVYSSEIDSPKSRRRLLEENSSIAPKEVSSQALHKKIFLYPDKSLLQKINIYDTLDPFHQQKILFQILRPFLTNSKPVREALKILIEANSFNFLSHYNLGGGVKTTR